MIVTTNELGDILSLTSRRIQDLENEGVINKVARNKWDLRDCVDKYLDYKISNATSSYGLTEARAKKELADAELKELILAEKKGEVIRLDKLEKELSDIASTLSNKLYNLPNRLKLNIAISDEVEIHLIKELEEILKELKIPENYNG
ncbi:hypothetical protein CPIN17260_0998 [Campylobacter pinnipediorum subsp. pinnipediorum]|uniref:hypothetical protein n=1 Tax=Campylobacter pinnipediorum TaxID=1965231 RepID=UPI0009954120|nr:hypothetical protein [Campylobacter pinnipediorum]AQW81292.1 hypothetical protein CPIN17260_0998 [Campylobacter pinnipediorum subsp. pinnipediorum]